ncbi:uncharacterized protein LOC124443514 [Xenia sp. Carnegie-2017]|uniref:uncharacterized protein LOC124443514 n=1 Tax=Xenia sp. Carnegie-2017 TaxID=2897299 RepID=UPI001F0495AE|nr:uncharacterized protein LOC124443514 [Xenia sp. Carnegie-2017]
MSKSGGAGYKHPAKANNNNRLEEGNDGRTTLDDLNRKFDQLTCLMNTFAPVVKELKQAYDAARQRNDGDVMSEGETDDEHSTIGAAAVVEDTASALANQSDALVDELIYEVTDNEPTDQPLPTKISKILTSILFTELNELTLSKRKEGVKRPKNCDLLRVTKVNPEIWDIARKSTRSMDARLQKLQEALIQGLIPISQIAGSISISLGTNPTAPAPTPEVIRDGLSKSIVLLASANHDLNMCRRDLFKVDLDENYKAICSNKEPVAAELFGDDLKERLKTVKESKKAAQQLTSQKRKRNDQRSYNSAHIIPMRLFYSNVGAVIYKTDPNDATIIKTNPRGKSRQGKKH